MPPGLYFYFECFALLVCLGTYKKLAGNFKVFLPFLAFVVVYEFANIKDWLMWHNTNAWCANLESILEIAIYSWLFASFDKRKSYRKKIFFGLYGIVAFSLIDMFFIQGFFKVDTIAMVAQYVMLATLACMYYFNLINSNDETLNIASHPPFWVSTGILLYALVFIFYHIAFNYMAYKNSHQFLMLAETIPPLACFVLYTSFSVAFVFQYRQHKSVTELS